MTHALFANQRETNLASTIALVDEVLVELGHAATTVAIHGALHAWRIPMGSSVTQVTLIHRSEFTHLRVCAVVMTLDDTVERGELFGHLLELNAGMCGSAFALDGDQILLVHERSTLDLDRSEILDAIRRVTTYADEYDNVLVTRFGGWLGVVAT